MAEADRIAAALRYQQELDNAQRPAFGNPNMLAQGRKMNLPERQAYSAETPDWMAKGLPMEGRATILPFRDTESKREIALPGLIASALNSMTAPGRAFSGSDPTFDPMSEGIDFALNTMGGGMAATRPASSLGMGGKENLITLYHNTDYSKPITKLQDRFEYNGPVSGMFASSEKNIHGGKHTYSFKIPNHEIAEGSLLYDLNNNPVALKNLENRLGEGELKKDVIDAIVNDKSFNYNDDIRNKQDLNLHKILNSREPNSAENSWALQHHRGQLAKDLGYKAVSINDEHGTSYLIPYGADVKINPHSQSAKDILTGKYTNPEPIKYKTFADVRNEQLFKLTEQKKQLLLTKEKILKELPTKRGQPLDYQLYLNLKNEIKDLLNNTE